MTALDSPTDGSTLDADDAATYAHWFASLGDPTRVRLLHAVATSPGGVNVGDLAHRVGISQSTCSHHVRNLADVGFLVLEKVGTATVVRVNQACCTGLPHAADAVMGTVATVSCCPPGPPDVAVRALADDDWGDVRRIYAEGIDTGDATFETEVPATDELDAKWLAGHRWVAVLEGRVAGWASASPTSSRACYSGVAETSVYVAADARGRGVGRALLNQQVMAADADDGLWTLQTSIFPENRGSLSLHRSAGFRIVGLRERIGQLDGQWRDTVLLERRAS
ncbi:L-amino acid N-acyltransferase YncA [Haloactinopolyspora alba]|uniref:L-amino acid N-acyltransferase YncA n=1 Tax=Haloactinopolyspora alba TaxID=648780 RepID=A0A2P8E3X3_9ACTN|nr:GNAT family N-acetyltransferase [Haloactinopolyspora alba]PSL04172.1 L-amino acid N-acyltransferase YncA [Haloactinopolyspora alba]